MAKKRTFKVHYIYNPVTGDGITAKVMASSITMSDSLMFFDTDDGSVVAIFPLATLLSVIEDNSLSKEQARTSDE